MRLARVRVCSVKTRWLAQSGACVLDSSKVSAYVRCKKPDNTVVFDKCEIDSNGKIYIELTNQILAYVGRVALDIIIVESITKITYQKIISSGVNVISTMTMYLNVVENVFPDKYIESKDEFSALKYALARAEYNYQHVLDQAEEYVDSIKSSEEFVTVKANEAHISVTNASTSEANAKTYADNASSSANSAKTSENNAKTYTNEAKVSENNTKVYAENAKASELLAKEYMEKAFDKTPEGYNANMELLASMDIQTTTDTTLYNSKDGGVKLNHMVGKTEQRQYCGYQLFDASKLPTTSAGGATVTNNGDGSLTVSGSGELTSETKLMHEYSHEETIKMLKNGVLNFITGAVYPYMYARLSNSNGAISYLTSNNTSYEITQDMLDDETFRLGIGFYGSKDSTIVPGTIKPMLYQDGDGTWESFTGGQPSPNPEYPQSLNHTGDCVEMVQDSYNANTRRYEVYTSKYPIPCMTNDVINIDLEQTRDIIIHWYNENIYISYELVSATKSASFSVPNGVTHFYIRIKDINGITPETVGKIELTVNGKYVGQIVEHGKNLFDENKLLLANNWMLSDGWYTGNPTYLYDAFESRSFVDDFKQNTQYTILLTTKSTGSTAMNARIMVKYTDGTTTSTTYFGNTSSENTTKFVSEKGKTISGLFFQYGNSNILYIKDFLIKETDIDDDTYEPYQENVVTYYTSEPPRDGDRLVQIDDVWQIERNSAEVVFDGTNTSLTHTDSYRDTGYNYAYRYIDYYDYTKRSSVLSNIGFTATGYNSGGVMISSNKNIIGVVVSDKESGVLSSDTASQTIAKINEWCRNNNVYVQYPLATPTYEVLDNQSQIALNSLKSFNGVTYVEIDSRVKPQEVSFDYGTSHVGALTIENANLRNNDNLRIIELESFKDEVSSKYAHVDVDISGGDMMYGFRLPDGFTNNNSIIIGVEHHYDDNSIQSNQVRATDDFSGDIVICTPNITRSKTVDSLVSFYASTTDYTSLTFEGTLRVLFQRIF